jgi:hypothetical protein
VTTYRTRINNETIRIEVHDSPKAMTFEYVSASEQCDDCGQDGYQLQRDRRGEVDCLVCRNCFTAYPLRKD